MDKKQILDKHFKMHTKTGYHVSRLVDGFTIKDIDWIYDAMEEFKNISSNLSVIKSVCSCVEAKGEEIGWYQVRHCNRCDKVIEQTVL